MVSTERKQVIKLGIGYLLAYIAYDSLSQAMYSIYSHYDMAHLSLINLIMVYIGFGPGNFISSYFINKLGLKRSLLCGFSGYLLFELFSIGMGFYLEGKTVKDLSFNEEIIIYVLNAIMSFLNGLSGSFIWIVNPTYLTTITNPQNITEMFGIFWSIYMWANVVGPFITIFVLGKLSIITYFVVVALIGFSSCIYVIIFISPKKNVSIVNDDESIMNGIKKSLSLVNTKTIPIWCYIIFAAISLSFYPIFMNIMIKRSLGDVQQSKIYQMTGYVFLAQGITQVISGLLQKQLTSLFQTKTKILSYSCIFIEMCYLFTIITYDIQIYWGCLFTMVIWAFCQVLVKTNIQGYIRQNYQGKMQYYAMNVVFFSIGACICYILLSILDESDQITMLVFTCLSAIIGVISSLSLKKPPNRLNFQEELTYEQLNKQED